jgi:uncharacterized protein YqgQ
MPRSDYVSGRAWKPDLERLHRAGLSDRAIARELSRLYAPAIFSRRMVRYYRAEDDRLAQDGECVPRERSTLQHRRAVHQMLRGFGHLLPLPLRRREADILALLKERGSMTGHEIREALGLRRLHTDGQPWMPRLLSLGLVEVVGARATWRGRRRVFAIAARALPKAEHRPLTIRPLNLEPLRVACG